LKISEEVIAKFEEKERLYYSFVNTIEELSKKQENVLLQSFEEMKPLAEWYLEKNFVFTHPNLPFHSDNSLILGYNDRKNLLYIWNIEEGAIAEIDLNKNEKTRFVNLEFIVAEGYFETAMNGINYLNHMLDEYTLKAQNQIDKLETENNSYGI